MSAKERGKEQDEIRQYCETHQLPQLLAFLVNQLAQKKDPHPKLYSVKYFADRVSDADLGTIGLYRSAPSEKNSTSLPGRKVVEADDSKPFVNPFQSDISKWMSHISPSAWLRLGEVRTANNIGALHCIYKMEEDSYEDDFSMEGQAGITALSAECYDAFHPLYFEFFRFVDATSSAKSLLTMITHAKTLKQPSFPLEAIKERISTGLPSSSVDSAVSRLTLSFHRNFAHIPFPPTMNPAESNQVIARIRKGFVAWTALRQPAEDVVVDFCTGPDLSGQEGHAFREVLTKDFLALKKSYTETSTSRRASALWLSPDKRIAVAVNWRDHLQVAVKIDDAFDAEEIARGLQDVFALFACIQEQEEDDNADVFAKHSDFGYLTVDPMEGRLGFSTFRELLEQAHMRRLRFITPEDLSQGLIPVTLNTLDCNDEAHFVGILARRLSGLLEGLKLRLSRPHVDQPNRAVATPYRLVAPVEVTAASIAFSELPHLLGKKRDVKNAGSREGEKKAGAMDRLAGLQALACPMGLDWWSGKVSCGFACVEDLGDYCNMSETLTSIVERYHNTRPLASTAPARYVLKAESSAASASAALPLLEALQSGFKKEHPPFDNDNVKLCACSLRRNFQQHHIPTRGTEEDLMSIHTAVVEALAGNEGYAGWGVLGDIWGGVPDVLKFYTACSSATSRSCGNITELLRDTGMQVEFSNFERAVGVSTKVEKGRGVFLSPSSDWLVAINFNDHVYIQAHEAGGDIVKCFYKLLQIAHSFQGRVSNSKQNPERLAYLPSLGYLTCFPEFLGTGLQLKVKLYLPYIFSTWEESESHMEKLYSTYSLGVKHVYPATYERGKPFTAMIWVMSTVTMGLTEIEQLEEFLTGIEAILELEQEKARHLGTGPRSPAEEKEAWLPFRSEAKDAAYSSTSEYVNKQPDMAPSDELAKKLTQTHCKDIRTLFGGTALQCYHMGRAYHFPGDVAATDADAFKKFRSLFEEIAGKQQKSSDVLLSATSSSRALVEVFDMFQISGLLDGLRKSVSLSTLQITNICLIACRNFASIPFLPYAVVAPAFTRHNTRGLLHLAEAERAAVERLTKPRDGDPPPLAGQKYIPVPWLTPHQLSILKTKFFVDIGTKGISTGKDVLGCNYKAFEFWPRHRGVIFSADQTLVCLVNFVDHVTLVARCDDKGQLCSGIGMLRALHGLRDTVEELETAAEFDTLSIAKNADFTGFLGPNIFRSVCLATAVAAQLNYPGSRLEYCNKVSHWSDDYPTQLEFIEDWNTLEDEGSSPARHDLQNSALVMTRGADFDHEVELLEVFLKILTVIATEC